ncbi:MAG: acyltransferase [Deltaproteobacteria bacterium]|nr:acyltransferase [Deltaproteobacteria bacterium]
MASSEHKSAKKYQRVYELDLLRLFAAASVMLYHYTFRGFAADSMSVLAFPALGEVFRYGYLGVGLFFMISGFVIIHTLEGKDARSLIASRAARLYPAYWAGVTLTAVVTVLIGGSIYKVSAGQYLANLTMLNGLFGVEHIDGVYWSLLVELKFYFLIFLLMVFGQAKRIGLFVGLWALAAFAITVYGSPFLVKALLFPKWAPYFIAGAAFCLMRREGAGAYWLVVVAIAYVTAITNELRKIPSIEQHYGAVFSEPAIIAVVTSFFLIFTAIALRKSSWAGAKGLVKLGALTYPLYLIHENIGFMAFNALAPYLNKYIILASAIAVMWLAAYLTNRYVEERLGGRLKRAVVSVLSVGRRTAARD